MAECLILCCTFVARELHMIFSWVDMGSGLVGVLGLLDYGVLF